MHAVTNLLFPPSVYHWVKCHRQEKQSTICIHLKRLIYKARKGWEKYDWEILVCLFKTGSFLSSLRYWVIHSEGRIIWWIIMSSPTRKKNRQKTWERKPASPSSPDPGFFPVLLPLHQVVSLDWERKKLILADIQNHGRAVIIIKWSLNDRLTFFVWIPCFALFSKVSIAYQTPITFWISVITCHHEYCVSNDDDDDESDLSPQFSSIFGSDSTKGWRRWGCSNQTH